LLHTLRRPRIDGNQTAGGVAAQDALGGPARIGVGREQVGLGQHDDDRDAERLHLVRQVSLLVCNALGEINHVEHQVPAWWTAG
jgi:hypothetical protein